MNRFLLDVRRAAALVLKAHKDAVNSLSGNGNAKLGTVAASVAAANATAQEAMKDIQASFRPSVVGVSQSSTPAANVSADNSTILKVIFLLSFVPSFLFIASLRLSML